ncbi:hypothetical protein [Thioalkalivibrio halophilus]|uniref:Uncharacterized protein n=1 Tax=Thioalkalivibrio halophilus TaxID=252474 RepID=A0A1V2ZV21_9GAMM|nr:hypothetical protein [Thioalkalivibrio halophilus]OOC08954.1 hypothetical protein B1A74_13560 [Thioalkalivibrio halophilus]
MKPKAQYIPGALLLALGATPLVAGVTIPHTFQSGETAVADEVNANFEALREELAAAQDRIADLESDRDDMQELHEHVEVINVHPDDPNAQTVRFSGVDVQIVNGEGETDIINGVGNLIVGYNEARGVYEGEVCSDGQYDDQTDCTTNGGAWAQNHKSGSHNIVGGSGNSYSSYGGLVVGQQNAINRDYASVSAGLRNIASGEQSSVSGGALNTAEGRWSSVSGGDENEASGEISSISGGWNNSAASGRSSVSGGGWNTAEGQGSSILGGTSATASGGYETIPEIE